MKLSKGTNASSKLPLINWFEEVAQNKVVYRAYMKSAHSPTMKLSAKSFQDRLQSYGLALLCFVTGLLKYMSTYITKECYQCTVACTEKGLHPSHLTHFSKTARKIKQDRNRHGILK